MSKKDRSECCPKFDPAPWDGKEITWEGKPFLVGRVVSFLHIPLNFGGVMRRGIAAIEAAGARPDEMVILADETSPWGADVYIAIAKEIPGARTVTLSGTFLAKVFEGPFKNMRNWDKEMNQIVAAKGKSIKQKFFYYTTCPKCAKKHGKNYVVILAQV